MSLNRPWARDLKRLVNDPNFAIICWDVEPINWGRMDAQCNS